VHGLHQVYHRVKNHFRCTGWYSEVMRLEWKLDSVFLKILLILRQDRCMVYTEHTIGLEIFLDAPDGTPR
jgi:hypothetical protein